MNAIVIGFVALAFQNAAELAHDEARRKLEAGDAVGAESAARRALDESLRFVPEQEIEVEPDKGILFEDMILEARETYRERRARYFRTLGDALAAQERWRAARKAYERAVTMVPAAELFLIMADDEDLSVTERLDYLLDAYLTPGADRSRLEAMLLETGSFRSRNALKASLDQRRFPELQSTFPDLELLDDAFPRFQVVTDAGTLNTAELYRQGSRLLVYVPVDACARCSEQLDGITVPVIEARRGDRPIVLAAFVPEEELPIARRIVRLLAMEVAVGRLDGLPETLETASTGELRIVARGGLTQIRIPMSVEIRASDIRRRVEEIFAFLDAPGLPTEETPEEASVSLVTLEEGANEHRTLFDWIDTLEKLEAGPAPLDDLYERLRRLTLSVVRTAESRELGFEILGRLGRLRDAAAAKTRAFDLLGTDLGDRLLEEAQKIDATVRRTAPPGQGVFYVAVTEPGEGTRRVILQRSFQTVDGLSHFDFVLVDDGHDLALEWLAPEAEPHGVVGVAAGAVFFFADEGCDGLRVVREGAVVYESCAGALIDGEVVEVRSALVDPVAHGPVYYKRNVASGALEESDLEKGLSLYDSGDMAGAATAFEAAMDSIDPEAPYDASDLVYNRGRALEMLGERQRALALYRSLGDVSYQELVDEGAGRIEGAPR